MRVSTAADPWRWCLAITALFTALVWWRLGTPSRIMFDEVHYVPAARMMLENRRANPEHPMVAKAAIALSIRIFGDTSWAWRVPSAIMGTVGLWAFGRALWLASGRRFATIVGTILLAVDFSWFMQSRIAMLDMVMAGFAMVMLWQILAAYRAESAGLARGFLLCAGIASGLSLGAKWSAMPVLALAPVALALSGALARRHRIGLVELTVWLGLVPLVVYAASFWPIAHWRDNAVPLRDLVGWHRYMLQLQDSVVKHHPYQSVWWQWVLNLRPIWFLWEHVDGAQRGVLLIGNPFAMLAGLPAVAWCIVVGALYRRWDALAAAGLYGVTLGMWAIDGKPIQFYYHYLMPAAFLMACLALMLDALWAECRHWGRLGWLRFAAIGAVAAAVAMFAWFFPIIAALPLAGPQSFAFWMWLGSWR